MRRRGSARLRDERGSMAVEIVVLVPALLLVMSLVVALGRFTSTQGQVRAAARDAVRAATLERDAGSALSAARSAATATMPDGVTCDPARLDGPFVAGGTLTVTLRCEVSWAGLAPIGLHGSTTVTEQSSAPLDRYRRVGGA